ncbi:hypothetical protein FHR92_000272 [Fontibacillus solani]|uniref:Uncharacterized protein n=1 Tax=Fontibacillus solani TaxID=1572857 RepID=A0A7W3SPR4_9BACL|nr:hypothetical protein [Fontibacillus solani]MBA9083829.1 hypothetical protein [Fontibacillus solani]
MGNDKKADTKLKDTQYEWGEMPVRARTVIKTEEFKNSWRDVEVTYTFGKTALGKTRSIMEQHDYCNVYRVTGYSHPFDGYQSQDIVLFDEFNGQFKL